MALGLQAEIGANSGGFVAAIKQAENAMGGFHSSLGRIGTAIGGAFSIYKIAEFTKKVYGQASGLDDLASNLGTTTQAIAGLQIASKMTGVSMESAEKILFKLNKTLGDAAENGGPAADALRRLGLNAGTLANIDKVQAFMQIQEALGGIENTATRTNLGFAILGKQSADAIKLMDYSLRQATEEAQAFGSALDAADAARLEDVGRVFIRIQAAIEGAAAKLMVDMLPTLEKLAGKVNELSKAIADLNKGGNGGGYLDTLWNQTKGVVKMAAGGAASVIPGVGPMLGLNGKGASAMMGEGLEDLKRAFYGPGYNVAYDAYTNSGTLGGGGGVKLSGGGGGGDSGPLPANSDIGKIIEELNKQAEDAWKKVYADIATPADKFNEQVALLNQLATAESADMDALTRAYEKYNAEFQDAQKKAWDASPEGQAYARQQEAEKTQGDAYKTFQDRLGSLGQSTMLDSMFSPSRRSGGTFGSTRDAGAQVAMSRGMAVADWQQKSAEYLRKLVEIAFDYQRSLSPEKVYL